MSEPQQHDDKVFLERVKATLDHAVDDIDPVTRARLSAARHRAVAAIGQRRPFFQPVAMVAMAASVMVLAVGVYLWMPTAPGTMPAVEDVPLLSSGEDFELLQELEFYRWLELEDRTT